MFRSLLIANRGEIALRIQRAARSLGIETIAVHSEADREARHVALADKAVCIGPASAARSYLDPAAILLAAEATGAEAVHPGYGFLSENADFAQACETAGLVFVGPPPQAIRVMGDKVAAKCAMRRAGVPCVPGPDEGLPDDPDAVRRVAAEIGYPVILKAAGGGGGRGMRVVDAEAGLLDALALTREEARRAFNNPEIYVEKFLTRPRHVEIQVLADRHGKALWLGSRDCSLQRRHQKVLEEAPAPGLDHALVAEVGARCAEACRQLGYVGAGTFEFLYEDGVFSFIEMNTRVQVEHPITEETTGIDIVREGIRVAAGLPLTIRQEEIVSRGHAFECRINAEDPESFQPSPGTITRFDMPGGPGIRVDTHMVPGARVPPHYDSLIAKIIAYGPTREEALVRLRVALSEARIEGVSTNLALHARILADPGFIAGGVDIHHLERLLKGADQP
ncbi:acetyl-CoA carboxylase biotin carboxylase subunit [Antarcticirhabdus aurantiaca]|uniref:Acetyl-CoA carboxylase biotin carboxylase subunit n=1 Tax=Antarcticirhabdus aurantiaca TaxID=2606717 RepID=A0ACD4NWZ2_9HYPH|nr:acetyl-CoA carboxylase biotin carboxylase subunit [Antarcticirhabdus aurantiaca]WAJ31386.1 acetyl-CoA carboxylase biotin carboxylase subunit [Jeongeuplla avenae]